MVAEWLEMSLGFESSQPDGSFCVERWFTCVSCVSVGFLEVLLFPHTV